MREKVFIHTVLVTRKGEINSFQIKLPADAKKIIGIESTVRGIQGLGGNRNQRGGAPLAGMNFPINMAAPSGGLFFSRTPLAGELRLQNHGPSNLFYSTDVKLSDANVGYGDFSLTRFWEPKVFSHGEKFLEDLVLVDDESLLLDGTYRDRFGEEREQDLNYKVNVYVWYAIEK